MAIDKKELQSRLWTEWTNGLKITADSLAKDQIDIINSICTCVLGDENFVQKAAIYVQRKIWIGKFSDYKTRIGAYETTIMDLLREANEHLSEKIEYAELGETCVATTAQLGIVVFLCCAYATATFRPVMSVLAHMDVRPSTDATLAKCRCVEARAEKGHYTTSAGVVDTRHFAKIRVSQGDPRSKLNRHGLR